MFQDVFLNHQPVKQIMTYMTSCQLKIHQRHLLRNTNDAFRQARAKHGEAATCFDPSHRYILLGPTN
jgi:hypothetical protein